MRRDETNPAEEPLSTYDPGSRLKVYETCAGVYVRVAFDPVTMYVPTPTLTNLEIRRPEEVPVMAYAPDTKEIVLVARRLAIVPLTAYDEGDATISLAALNAEVVPVIEYELGAADMVLAVRSDASTPLTLNVPAFAVRVALTVVKANRRLIHLPESSTNQ